jgi:hypothetical protein
VKSKMQGRTSIRTFSKFCFVEDQKYTRFKSRDHVELLGTDKLEELKEKENLKKESVTSSVLVYCSLMRALRARA